MDRLGLALQALSEWFSKTARVLPWRSDKSPYRVWVSEVMLQQTQVKTVTPYFEKFAARFPDVETLASAEIDEVMRYWAGLGYYSRARNLHRTAQAIARTGVFPSARRDLESLPGIGHYTAGAVLSIAFDLAEPILDANVERVLSRLRRLGRHSARFKRALWRYSACIVKKAAREGIPPSVCNQALMEIGALVCLPKKPHCAECPLASVCKALAAGDEASYPGRAAPKLWRSVGETVYCLTDGEGCVLLERRESGSWRSGLWDFPEELPPDVRNVEETGTVTTRHVVTNHRIERTTRICRAPRELLVSKGGLDYCLVPLEELAAGGRGNPLLPPVGSAVVRTAREVLRAYPEP